MDTYELNLQSIMHEIARELLYDGFRLPSDGYDINNPVASYKVLSGKGVHGVYYVFYRFLEGLAFEVINDVLKINGDHIVTLNSPFVSRTNDLVLNLPLAKTVFNVKILDYKEITPEEITNHVTSGHSSTRQLVCAQVHLLNNYI